LSARSQKLPDAQGARFVARALHFLVSKARETSTTAVAILEAHHLGVILETAGVLT
jgi:hypothetical protein